MTPKPVASVRPSDPPMPTGLPVMKPGYLAPMILSYSSMIQIICWALVMTSGAGTSCSGPTMRAIWRTQPRQICSCSRRERLCGSQMTPPLPPPSGMSTTEHFQVIQVARALTVSMVSWGWKRMPPLHGPRESLCCTRKPWKTLTVPSSILTGMRKWNSRIGLRSRSRVAWSRSSFSATLSNCVCAILKALNDLSAIYGNLLVIFWLGIFYHFSGVFVNSLLCNNKFSPVPRRPLFRPQLNRKRSFL